MIVLETERLFLAEVNLADGVFILELLNSPGWLEFIGDSKVRSIADAHCYIEAKLVKSYQQNGFGLFKMVRKSDKKTLGLCGLINRPTLEDIDIGFGILPQYGGKGYTYEAASAILGYAEFNLILSKVVGITSVENVKSQNLLRKLGLKDAGRLELMFGERLEEVMLFSKTFNSVKV